MALVHELGWDPRFLERSGWFWPLARAAERFVGFADWPRLHDYGELYAELTRAAGVPGLCFGENVRKQDKREAGRVVLSALYDGRIVTRGEVPTRERDWHDFFNVLCFATFPRMKHALHGRQYAALVGRVPEGATRLPSARSSEQDALTLFDEGGVVVAALPEVVRELARTVEGPRVPAQLPAFEAALDACMRGGEARVVPFGHALFEHLVEGLEMPSSRTCLLALPSLPSGDRELLEAVDCELALVLRDPRRFTTPREQVPLRLSALVPPRAA